MKKQMKRGLALFLAAMLAANLNQVPSYAADIETAEEVYEQVEDPGVSAFEAEIEEEVVSDLGNETEEAVEGFETLNTSDFQEEVAPATEEEDGLWDGVTTVKEYVTDSYKVTFFLTGFWEGGYNASVTVENKTGEVLHDWYLLLETEDIFSNIWNAEVAMAEEGVVLVKNGGWNQDIAPSAKIEFGLSVNKSFEGFPADVDVLSFKKESSEKDYSVEYNVLNDWGHGFTAEIKLSNNKDAALEDWVLEFDYERNIDTIWNGVIESHEGNHYVIRNSGYNANINPGSFVTIGFNGSNGTKDNVITNARLTTYGDYMEGLEPDDDEEIPDFSEDSDGDGLKDFMEEIFETDKNNPDTDGDGINDYDEIFVTFTDPLVSDAKTDNDGDGLTNIQEIALGTDPNSADSDSDTLSDADEINVYGTNPLLYDTDGDAVSDGREVEMGTDPLSFNEYFETVIYSEVSDTVKVSVKVNLKGEQVESLAINKYEDDLFFPETMPGYIGGVYDFSVDGTFGGGAVITFEFDEGLLDDPDFDPVIYYWDEENQELIPLETTVTGNVATAVTPHFSKYVLIDRKVYEESFTWQDTWATTGFSDVEVVLVIDDSGSMDWNDPSNQRLSVARTLIDNLPKNSKVGVIKFENSTTVYTKNLTTDKEEAKKYLTTSYFKAYGGTYMYAGINNGFSLFESDEDTTLKMMVVLSDGDAHDVSRHSATVTAANNAGVRLYTVGLGTSSSTYFTRYLKPMAEDTGAKFYLASDSSKLSEIFEDINEKIDIETDSDQDGLPDFYEDHMVLFTGVTIQLDKNNPDTDGDGVLDGEEVCELKYEYNADKTQVKVTGKIHSNPIEQDSDFDGIGDSTDILPMDNVFKGKMSGYYTVADATYTMDLRKFFGDSTGYDNGVCSASLMLANNIYNEGGFNYTKGANANATTCEKMLEVHEFNSIKNYKLKNSYSDDDISEVSVGVHPVTYDGVTKEIVAVVVRGTNGTIEEWSSNFDMGDPDVWKNDYHKGFYTAEERIKSYVDNYVSTNVQDKSDVVFWVTGHSRGAAIANILSSRLIDDGYNVYGYTFATPETTVKSSANDSKYSSIFNIVNRRDVVTYLPAEEWGFRRFGRTKKFELGEESLVGVWKYRTGNTIYNALEEGLINSAIDRIVKSCAGSWSEVFDLAGSQNIDDDQYNMFSWRSKRYCSFEERKTLFFGNHKGWKVYPSLAMFFQFGAEALAGSQTEKDNVSELLPEFWNSKFAGAILLFLGGVGFDSDVDLPEVLGENLVGDGHAPATYYVAVHDSDRLK